MGQKVNPHGFRVGVIKDWDSRWIGKSKQIADFIEEDDKIRKFIKKNHYEAGISKIEIERAVNKASVRPHRKTRCSHRQRRHRYRRYQGRALKTYRQEHRC